MKITHFTRQFHPATGGLESFVLALATAQKDLGHEVDVVSVDRVFTRLDEPLPAEDEVDGIRIHRVPHRGSRRYPIAPAIRTLGRNSDIRHVHAIDFFYDFLGMDNWFGRQPLVATTHGGFFHTRAYYRIKKVWFSTLTPLSGRGYDAIAACSPNDERLFRPVLGDKVRLIDNGVDVGKFAEAGSAAPLKSIVSIGRFGANKRLDRMLSLMAALIKRDPEWRLAICGVDYDWTRAELQAEIDRLGLSDAVTIHYGKSNEEIRDLLGDVSFFISASEFEGFALAPVEAMSAGLMPLLQADNTVFQDFSRRHPTPATLIDFDKADAAAAKVQEVYAKLASDGASMRAEAMRIAQGYAWRNAAQRYLDLYEEIIARYGERPAGERAVGPARSA